MRTIKFRVWDAKEKKFVELSHHKQAVLLTDDGFEMSTGWDSLDNPTFGNLDDLGYTKMSDDKFKEYQNRFIYLEFTGLHDKSNKNACVYEGDIVSPQGIVIGNKYETPEILKNGINVLIEGIGTKTWTQTEKEGLARGLHYAK